jgi:diaminopimelate epimerase
MCFETKVGIYQSEVIKSNVRVRLGNPTQVRLNFPLQLNDGVHNVSFANTGVPHVVFLVEKLEEIDVTYVGTQIRYHKDFEPAGTNANFVQVRSNQEIDVRTYERGVEDETFACGTGSVAGVVILAVNGKVSSPVKVNTLSGFPLTVYFNLAGGEVQDIYLEGDARFICEGQISESAWKY